MIALVSLWKQYVERYRQERKNHSQPYRPRFRLFVIAANRTDAEQWARNSGVDPRSMVYVHNAEMMRGHSLQQAQLIWVKGWGAHPQAKRIAENARLAVRFE